MADLEFIIPSAPVAEGLNLFLQAAGGGSAARHLSSWGRIQAEASLQSLGRNERFALAAALIEHGQALVNQAGSDAFKAIEPDPEAYEKSIYCFEAAGQVVQGRYYEEDDGLAQEVHDYANELVNRLYREGPMRGSFPDSHPFRLDVETVVIGFMALKVLGPFAEAFAKKLGELLAERTDKAIDRVHLTRQNRKPQVLKIRMPAGTTVLALPDDFSDDAKMALLDLDVTAGLDGAILRWNPGTSAWEKEVPKKRRIVSFLGKPRTRTGESP